MTTGEGETARRVVARLVERSETVACAESLTGGLVTSRFVDVPGASAVLRGGIVAYATPLKAVLLGVDAGLLAERGAVDPEVARQMALGVRRVLGTDWGVATTGVAGPDPQDGQPVGTVHVAVAGPGAHDVEQGRDAHPHVTARRLLLSGDREAIRLGSVDAVLELLAEQLG